MPLPDVYSIVQLVVGTVLSGLGAYLCLRWYTFWKGNFKGRLLTSGPYARVRHPFYSGFLILVVGLAVLIPSFETLTLPVISFPVIFYYVKREEDWLVSKYGRAYLQYMERVPWRLFPGVY